MPTPPIFFCRSPSSSYMKRHTSQTNSDRSDEYEPTHAQLTASASIRPPRDTLIITTPCFIVAGGRAVRSRETPLRKITDALLPDDVIRLRHERHMERDDVALFKPRQACTSTNMSFLSKESFFRNIFHPQCLHLLAGVRIEPEQSAGREAVQDLGCDSANISRSQDSNRLAVDVKPFAGSSTQQHAEQQASPCKFSMLKLCSLTRLYALWIFLT
eukprot:751511-Hanusia_phi.AAC.7